jgi:sugar phosphate permease
MSRYRWVILAGGCAAQASVSAVFLGLPAIAPAIRTHYGLSLTEIGVVLAAQSFGQIVTLLPSGLLADRFGERVVIGAGLTATAVLLAVAGYTSTFGGLVLALALAGGAGAGVNAATGRAVMSWFGQEERGLALGIRQTAVPVGGAIAALVLPALVRHVSVRAAFLALAIGCAGAAAIAVAVLRAEPGERAGSVGETLRDARVWRICAGSTFYVTTQLAMMSFLVLFLHDHRGVATGTAAAALAAAQVLGGGMRIAAGRWSDRVRARIVPLRQLGLLIAFGATLTALLVDAPLALLVPVLVIATTLSLSWNGLSFTAAAEAAGRGRSGAALGLQQTFLAGGSILAPIGFATLVHHTSWRSAFVVIAFSPLAGWALLAPLAER